MGDMAKMLAIAKAFGGSSGGSGSGGGGVIYIAETLGTVLVTATAYADEACTTALTYEQGKAIISKPFVITSSEEDMTVHAFPILTTGNDADKTATVIIFNPQDATPLILTLTFSDTPT